MPGETPMCFSSMLSGVRVDSDAANPIRDSEIALFYLNGNYAGSSHESSTSLDERNLRNGGYDADVSNGPARMRCRSKSEGETLKGVLRKESVSKSPVQRKVSFADANGMRLEEVKTFVADHSEVIDDKDDLLPRPDVSALQQRFSTRRRFVPYFTLPWSRESGKKTLLDAILDQRNICLESLSAKCPWRISGTVLVKNLSFGKRVTVRRTMDSWKTYVDVDALYLTSVNGGVDRFHFDLQFGYKVPAGARLEVAFCYAAPDGVQYWDNNGGYNYAFWFSDNSTA